ncbi:MULTISPECIES: DUF4097 family beta strand repeat-containing protein [Parabacteroides]|uniref:DUF4097 family beta strand repeat-containing protein n=1 Tax=Parabacteroides provencensis TaxID=1944636 RepID=UPI000C15A067|nr:DUF4097 family beta strand repeat-containing protein [Parabacteroides provencensis]
MKYSVQTKNYSLCLVAMLMLLCSLPALAKDQGYTKRKEINKSFNVSMNDLLQVDNRYGNITIAYWGKKEVAFRIVIESKSSNESRAQTELDRVNIDLQKSGNTVSAITSLAKSSGNWNWGNGENNSLNIHYYINIPNGLAIDLTQKYGNIDLPASNDGKCDLHVKYGNLKAGNFKAGLTVEAKYSNVTIGNVNNAELEVGYAGNVSIGNAKELNIDSKYSNLTLQDVKKLSLEKKYGNLKAGTIESVSLEMKYSEGTIQAITSQLIVDELSYGSLTVKELSPNFREVNVNARYGNLNLNIPAKAAFKVSADNMKYGNYSIKGFNITSSEKEDKRTYRSEINNGGNRTIYFNGNGYSNLKINAN